MYGTDEESWCPHCHAAGEVVGMDGQIPFPQLYGNWVVARDRGAKRQRAERDVDHLLARFSPATGDPLMKQAKSHSGDFVCPQCCIEYHLIAERGHLTATRWPRSTGHRIRERPPSRFPVPRS
jgi:hypothetical protein